VSSNEEALLKVCARHGLTVVSMRPGAAGGSLYVAHVQDAAGTSLLLKQTTSERREAEIAALRAWSGTGASVRIVAELEGGAYLAEWIDGVSVADLPPDTRVDFETIGHALRSLHSVSPPEGVADVRAFFASSFWSQWHELDPDMIALLARVSESLLRHESPTRVLLHGDMVPSNVIMTARGPKVIDPFGRMGPSAWDLAQLSVAGLGRGRRRLVEPLIEGYGEKPAVFDEMFAWMLLFFLRNNLAAGRQAFVDNLRPFALRLVSAGDPSNFVRACSEL
jgi:hypothetical protein